jgi:hypothetical protein
VQRIASRCSSGRFAPYAVPFACQAKLGAKRQRFAPTLLRTDCFGEATLSLLPAKQSLEQNGMRLRTQSRGFSSHIRQ